MEKDNKKKINIKVLIIIIALLIICLVGGLIAVLFLTDCDNTQQKKLIGKELQTGIYKYDLIEPDSFHETFIKDDYIYYLVTDDGKFEYYKKNIYTNEDTLIGTFKDEDYYCYVSNEHIKCSSENNLKIYDYNFKTIYDGDNKVIIPYKDTYIEIKDNKIYLNNKEYKTLPGDYSDYDVYEYNEFDNNLYLFFSRAYTDDQCLYNLEKNKCEEYDYKGIKDYSNGYYYYDDEKIYITDSHSDEIKEYNNILGNDINYSTALSNNLIYNYSDYYIKIYNLNNGKVSLINYLFDSFIERIEIDNNLLSLIEGSEVYIINLDEIELNEITVDELKEFFNNKLQEKIDLIRNDYSVEVVIKEDADLKFDIWKQTIKGERDYSDLSKSLDKTIDLLKNFGPEFFKSFIHDEWKGLKIYIAEDIESGDTFDYDGEAFRYYDYYSIILTTNDYTRTLSHELMHTLEDRINAIGDTSFPEWSNYNPKGYKYATKYNQYGTTYKYTVGYGTGDYYFLDNYSQTNELEDRARIFENIYMDTTTDIMENPYILNKAKYQVSEIIKYYPMIADMKMFEPFKA